MPGYSGSSTSVEKESFENMISKSDFSQKLNIIIFLLGGMFAMMIYCKLTKKK